MLIYWFNATRAEAEQRDVLLPLSQARAATVRRELVELGVAGGLMSIQGYGAAEPLVPHSDLENRWKNRRVELILVQE